MLAGERSPAPDWDQLRPGRGGGNRTLPLPLRPVGRHGDMASRMESHGTSNEIQITRPTWELLRDDFVTEPMGLVDVKGKGDVETWRLVSRNGH